MRRFLLLIIAIVFSVGAYAEARPNIVLIFTDDQGYQDLSSFGSPDIDTPNIDRIAAEGMKFTDFYAAAPVCTPSRAALMTGCYPPRVSMGEIPAKNRRRGRGHLVLFPHTPEYGLNTDEMTVAELLKERGYATACVGKWHLGHTEPFLPTEHGFDYYFGIPYSNDMDPDMLMRDTDIIEESTDQDILTERYTEEAVEFIRDNADEPFFLYVPHSMPHTPLHVSDRFRGKSDAGLYGDVIEMIDWSTGEILTALDELDVADNTLVIFTSDNGPWLVKDDHGGHAKPLRSGKGTTFEGGMRVPCVMRWPDVIPAGSVCGEVATALDILPTVADITGAELPQDRRIDGKSILPLMNGEEGADSPHVAFYYYRGNNLEAVRSGPWKLMFERTKGDEFPYQRGRIENHRDKVPEALYNLDEDIGETTNVIDHHPQIAERLRALADQMRNEIGDGWTDVEGEHVRPVGYAPEYQDGGKS